MQCVRSEQTEREVEMMPETRGTRVADYEIGVGFAWREGGVIARFSAEEQCGLF